MTVTAISNLTGVGSTCVAEKLMRLKAPLNGTWSSARRGAQKQSVARRARAKGGQPRFTVWPPLENKSCFCVAFIFRTNVTAALVIFCIRTILSRIGIDWVPLVDVLFFGGAVFAVTPYNRKNRETSWGNLPGFWRSFARIWPFDQAEGSYSARCPSMEGLTGCLFRLDPTSPRPLSMAVRRQR